MGEKMAEVKPFRGIMYSNGDLKNRITEPYDKISKEMQDNYYKKDPYNFIRLNLPKGEDPYNSSKMTLQEWLSKGILRKDDEPYFYRYVQTFNLQGKTFERNGFFAAVKLERYDKGIILPHERTFRGPKEDRLKMLKSTNVDLEPVFFLYDDPEMKVLSILKKFSGEKVVETEDENGVIHTIYKVKSNDIEIFFRDKKLVIADGHHRYETALTYSEEMGGVKATGYIMAVLVNRYDEGLIILPSHRIIEESTVGPEELLDKIKEFFNVKEIDPKSVKGFINEDIIYCFKDHAYVLKLKPEFEGGSSLSEKLNVSILNKFVISKLLDLDSKESIKYARWPEEVWSMIENGKAKFAFILKPVNPSTVWDVASRGEIMPQKSTDFYPKLISGLEMFDLNCDLSGSKK